MKNLRSILFALAMLAAVGIVQADNGSGGSTGKGGSTGTGGGGGNGSIGPAPKPLTGGTLMQHNDLYRTGRNMEEGENTGLTRANVASGNFGIVGRLPVDGQVYAQPLVANGVIVPGSIATKNLVIVVTENDSIYAYDVTSQSLLQNAKPLWKREYITECTSTGATCSAVDATLTVTAVQTAAPNIAPTIGMTATPVIDPISQTIYFTAMTSENGVYYWKLHAVALGTGAEQPNSPVTINGSYPGNGAGSDTAGAYNNAPPVLGMIPFNPITQLSRAGLILNNSTSVETVTVPFTTFDDNEPSHGWVFTYNASTLQPVGSWMTTPNSGDGSMWQAGGAPCVDSDGGLIFATANGDNEFPLTTPDLSDSIIKLNMTTPNASNPNAAYPTRPTDFFTPYNNAALTAGDVEVGSGGVLCLPDEVGTAAFPHVLIGGGKQGTIYLINRDNMGGLATGTSDTNILQELTAATTGISGIGTIPTGSTKMVSPADYGTGFYGLPAYYNGKVYFAATADYLRSVPITTTACATDSEPDQMCPTLNWSGMQKSGVEIARRGATPTISSSDDVDANNDAIVWYTDNSAYQYSWPSSGVPVQPHTVSDGTAVLYAFSTDNLSAPLYSSPAISLTTNQIMLTQNDDVCGVALGQNAAGCAVKFTVPTVQNGMVFVGTNSEISVYGLTNETSAGASEKHARSRK